MVNYCRGDGSGVSEGLNQKMKMHESTCFGKETYSWEGKGESQKLPVNFLLKAGHEVTCQRSGRGRVRGVSVSVE